MVGEELTSVARQLRVQQRVLESSWVGVAPPTERPGCVENGGLNNSRCLGPLHYALDE